MVDLNIQLPESFFQEEERSSYLVSAKTKELWAVELDLLQEFDRVCRKYDLNYMLDFGTLLGAVRHQGFIPWDDDIDVAMLREDYDKLLEVAPYEFKEPYFLQNHHSEPTYADTVTKLRRSDTTVLLAVDLGYKRSNHGIFIDIFVYDRLPSDHLEQLSKLEQFAYNNHYRRDAMAYVPSLDDGLKMIVRYIYYNLRYLSVYKQYDKLERFAKQFKDGPYRACIMFGAKRFYPITWFEETIEVKFENLMLPISAQYEEQLRSLYGDYMTPVVGGSAHSIVYYNTGQSYRDVMKDKAFMKELRQKYNHFK